MASARNIKDRLNRQKVTSIITRISESLHKINFNTEYKRGIFIFCGYDEYDTFIMELLEPEIEYRGFFYSCSNSFRTDVCLPYFEKKYGSITFICGDYTDIYIFIDGRFIKYKTINGLLIKRQKKGGQSAQRFDRLAEESRASYTTRVVDSINSLRSLSNFDNYVNSIFGADEMRGYVINSPKLLVKLNNGGFYRVTDRCITDKDWSIYLDVTITYEDKYREIIKFLDVNIDILSFDHSIRNSNEIKYYLGFEGIPIPKSDSQWSRLSEFTYIGVKFFSNPIENDECDN